jgi:branched-chain amino acid transport system ATP-binding protein
MLRARSVEAGYGSLLVLKGISLHVNPGEIVTIIGSNGAGKSTLLNTLAGLLPTRSGTVTFGDTDITGKKAERIVALGCTLVPEGRQLFATMTVRENLLLGAYRRTGGNRSRNMRESQERVYRLFPVLRERESQLAGTLSGGEQQMLAIGRALMSRPMLIMMDEPSMGLAPLVVRDILNTIMALRGEGNTILLVEQNARAALKIADPGQQGCPEGLSGQRIQKN